MSIYTASIAGLYGWGLEDGQEKGEKWRLSGWSK